MPVQGGGMELFMCRFYDLRDKEVININDGSRLGFAYDAEISLTNGTLKSIIVPGPYKFFGIFGRGEDVVVLWDKIKKIGDDIILVDIDTVPELKYGAKKIFRRS